MKGPGMQFTTFLRRGGSSPDVGYTPTILYVILTYIQFAQVQNGGFFILTIFDLFLNVLKNDTNLHAQ